MKEFLNVQTPEQIYKKIERFQPVSCETVPIEEALHRVLAEDVVSNVNLPEFRRSTVDGFAVKAKDTYGASESNPALLEVVGEIRMGEVSDIMVGDGQAVRVATGGMVPAGADAVEMVEFTESIDSKTIHVFKAVSPFENVMRVGEDVKSGETVLRKGRSIRPQDLGLMAGIGKEKVSVYRKPVVAILSSGDEIIPIGETPKPGQVRDINRYTICSAVREIGAVAKFIGIARDRFDDLKAKIQYGLKDSDMVVITGGSSVGTLDLTLEVIQSFDRSEIIGHGISIRPGKPTLIADVGGKPILGLPGHPVSALVIFHLFARPILKMISGYSGEEIWRYAKLRAKASRNIPSLPGREDYVRIRLEQRNGTLWADPIFGKSGAIKHLAQADGLIRIGLNEEGLEAGEEAEVILL